MAAHITAAARGGPRYDPVLSGDERSHNSNGIHLCGVCAKLIDSDENHYTVELLQNWKQTAKKGAFEALTTGRASVPETILPLELDPEHLECFGLSRPEDINALTSRLRAAARQDVENFKATPGWPCHAIALDLRVRDSGDGHKFDVFQCAAGIEASRELCIVAPPGTGKTTTLIQLAEAILASDDKVAVFVPLSEWSSQSEGMLASLSRRVAYRGIPERHFTAVALSGRLVLLLDGWNQLDSQSRRRATAHLKQLQRDLPLLEIVVSTRRQALDVPISGPTVEIEPLSEAQQVEIARATGGATGEALLDHAWRTPGVRELVSIPLYLNALLSRAPGGTMPTTKEEILHLFITEHEESAENAEALHSGLHDLHAEILIALAVETTITANTTITDRRSRAVVKHAEDILEQNGQIAVQPQPTVVLELLVNHHTLVRAGGQGGVSFQHQQFQEWYASFQVEKLMQAAVSGNHNSANELKIDVLNMPAWEEPILFACERLSRAGQVGVGATSWTILNTLAIDPMLAAEMIYHSAHMVWREVKDEVVAFVDRWHVKGTVDRAVRFMITTGQSEFASEIWSLIVNSNEQISFQALRSASPFRPSVLGDNPRPHLAEIPDDIRERVVAEIASNSGMDGMELAADLAKADPSPEVQFAIVAALQFRRGDRLVKDVLEVAAPSVWTLLAQKGYAHEMADPQIAERLRLEEQRCIENEPNELRRLGLLLESGSDAAALGSQIETLIESPSFPVEEQNARWSLRDAFKHYPEAVVSALLHRLEAGHEIPFQTEELLEEATRIDEGPIVSLVLDLESPKRIAEAAATIVGPKAVGVLIDKFLATGEKWKKFKKLTDEEREKYFSLRDRIQRTRLDAFIEAWLCRCDTDRPSRIAIMADLFACHGIDANYKGTLRLDEHSVRELVATCQGWAQTLLSSEEASRHDIAELTRAIVRLARPELVDPLHKLLVEDLTRWRRAREQFNAARARGVVPDSSDVRMSYTNQYARAFAAIGGERVVQLMKGYLTDPEFGLDAAAVLKEIWQKEQETPKAVGVLFRPDFSRVRVLRSRRREAPGKSSPLGEMIFSVVEQFLGPQCSEAEQSRALQLATIALSMPYRDKAELIKSLLALPLPVASKRGLLTALVLAGDVINADIVLEGVKAFLDATRDARWMPDQRKWNLEKWLELLPFTDHPSATLDALDLFPAELLRPWDLRGLLAALRNAPDADAERILVQLAVRDPNFLKESEWLSALLGGGTDSACLTLIELLCDPKLAPVKTKIDGWAVSNRLAEFVNVSPSLRTELVRRYRAKALEACHPLIELVLAKSPDTIVVLEMVRRYAASKRKLDRLLYSAIEGVALERRPARDWHGAYEVYSVAVPELRKQLFAMIGGDCEESGLAEACLTAIDELRDEHERVEFEPRHPDIESGRPWPLAALWGVDC